MSKTKKHCVISLSGGMDSSTLLLRALKDYDTCTAISFDYGQKHRVELERAQSLIGYLASKGHKVNYRQIQLKGLVDLLDSALVEGGEDVPEGHYEQDNMVKSVVPNRNKIFSSITQAVALSVANLTEETCDIALGVHSGDHQIYPDCTSDFRDADYHAFKVGNWGADQVKYFTPYMEGNKFTILQDGEILCDELGLDFDEVYKRTNTSYKPYPSGNSDYKSSSSVERIEAFIALGRKDPIQYEDESGLVSWEVAKSHAKKVIAEFHNKN